MIRSTLSWGLAFTGLCLAPALAQTYEQIAPKTPPAAPPATLPIPTPAEAGGSDAVLVKELLGIKFVPSASAIVRGGVTTTGLDVSDLPLLQAPDFFPVISGYLGKPLSFKLLNQLTREVVLYCRGHDRPIVDVLVPEQNVNSGSVQIVVLQGRVGKVAAEGTHWFKPAQIIGPVRLTHGDVITGRSLLEDLAWINQNPFRQVDLVFARGQQQGETDVILRTNDRRPIRVYAGYEDSGNALTSDDRVIAGFNWGNAFGLQHLLNYQLTASPDFSKLVAHSGSYVIPINRWRHTFTVFGSYAESEPDLAGGVFSLKGKTAQVSARYTIPLKPVAGMTHDITFGTDYKRSNNDLAFGGTRIFAQETDVIQGVLTYNAAKPDRLGTTAVSASLFYSPGGLSNANHTSRYQAARAYAKPEYAYGRLTVDRTTNLPQEFSWLVRGVAQLSSTNLLGSEQLGLGGYDNLRGYEEREGNGDSGFYITNELHGPPLQLASRVGLKNLRDRFIPLVFFDYGVVASHRRVTGELHRIEMASSGLGIRYQLANNLTVRVDYGWQLKDSGVSDGRLNNRGHVGVTLAY